VFCIFILDYTDIATTSAAVTTETDVGRTESIIANTTTITTTTVSVSYSTAETKALPTDNTDPTSQLGFLHHFCLPCRLFTS